MSVTSSSLCKKRDWSKHSRSDRAKRSLEKASSVDCHSIEEYFPILNQLDLILLENQQLKQDLAKAISRKVKFNVIADLPISNVMKMLLQCAINNAGKLARGWRYTATLIDFATMIFTLSGPRLYGTLTCCKNFPLPSISTVLRNLMGKELLREGSFRFISLRKNLEKENKPKLVWMSEDASRVDGKVQYDSKGNQIVGLVPPLKNGVPVPNAFPATSATVIASYFENGVVSNNGHVVMAQPLTPGSPSYMVGMYGTDNRYTAQQVDQRWTFLDSEAEKEGIQVVGWSTDGDPKALKVMFCRTFRQPGRSWPWFSADRTPKQVYIQDTIHLLVKLRSKISRASVIMPMGKDSLASRGHIISLVNTVSKDQHELTETAVDVKDKMNYRSAQKLCDQKVSDLLRSEVPGSEGTALYMDMMRETTAAFLDPVLEPLNRIKYSWKWIFFCRMWRQWILGTPGYTLGHNFITSNAFTCLELNGHGLIQIIIRLRDSEQPELFCPWRFSSQPCEEFFRKLRSMTTTESTVTNFSILEMEHRVRRIDFLQDVYHKLKDTVAFPQLKHTIRLPEEPTGHFSPLILPEDYQIQEAVEASFQSALQICIKLGMARPNTKMPLCPLKPSPSPNESLDDRDVDEDEDDDVNQQLVIDGEDEVNTQPGEKEQDNGGESESLEINADEEYNSEDDVEEDLLMVSTGSLGDKALENVHVTPSSPYVKVLDGNSKVCVIKKSFLVYLLRNGDIKMSSDRQVRVKTDNVRHVRSCLPPSVPSYSVPIVEEEIALSEWCAFLSEDGSVAVGRVLAFSYMSGTTWRNQEYSAKTAPVKAPDPAKKRGLGVLCNWFQIGKQNKLQPTKMDLHGYYNIETYICTLPRPRVQSKCYVLPCTQRDILRLRST